MNAKERYNRLKDLQTLATRLQVALIEEADLALAEVKEIERSVVESNRRVEALEDLVSWDGNQWDGIIADGTCWRRPTLRDLGRIIRVSGSTIQTENPAKFEQAELVGFTVVDGSPYYVCLGTIGQHVYWPHAWIESNPCEEIKPLNGPCASIAVVKSCEPEKRYRDVTKDDIGKPVEVSDWGGFWVEDVLSGFVGKADGMYPIGYRFFGEIFPWRHARIEVTE